MTSSSRRRRAAPSSVGGPIATRSRFRDNYGGGRRQLPLQCRAGGRAAHDRSATKRRPAASIRRWSRRSARRTLYFEGERPVRAIVLVDLDDTLFQTLRKCPPDVPAERAARRSASAATAPRSASRRRARRPSSPGSARPTLVVPVTGAQPRRARAGCASTRTAAVCAHGGVILDDDGEVDPRWAARDRGPGRARTRRRSPPWPRRAQGTQGDVRGSWPRGGTDLYLLLKDPDGDETLLDPRARPGGADGAGRLDDPPQRQQCRLDAALPRQGACGARAAAAACGARHPDAPVIGIGDSLIGRAVHGLVRLCDDAGRLAARRGGAARRWPDDRRASSRGLAPFSGSYDPDDVIFLMKPVALAPTDVAAKERLIQSGARHYSEMVAAREAPPGAAYLRALPSTRWRATAPASPATSPTLAGALAERAAGRPRSSSPRWPARERRSACCCAGRCERLGVAAPHYSISIIRDRGIDREALRHIAARHDPRDVGLRRRLDRQGRDRRRAARQPGRRAVRLPPCLAVVADPAGQADLAATGEDYLIPSGILNAIVSGPGQPLDPQRRAGRPGRLPRLRPLSAISRRTISRAPSSTPSTRWRRRSGRARSPAPTPNAREAARPARR